MVIHKVDLCVSIFPRLHVMQYIVGDGHLGNEHLRALSHHKHREVVVGLVMRFHVFQDCAERFLVLLVHYSFDRVSRAVYSVNLIQHICDIFFRV